MPYTNSVKQTTLMDDFDFAQLDDRFDRINDFDEDEEWTSAVLGEDEDLIRQLVG